MRLSTTRRRQKAEIARKVAAFEEAYAINELLGKEPAPEPVSDQVYTAPERSVGVEASAYRDRLRATEDDPKALLREYESLDKELDPHLAYEAKLGVPWAPIKCALHPDWKGNPRVVSGEQCPHCLNDYYAKKRLHREQAQDVPVAGPGGSTARHHMSQEGPPTYYDLAWERVQKTRPDLVPMDHTTELAITDQIDKNRDEEMTHYDGKKRESTKFRITSTGRGWSP